MKAGKTFGIILAVLIVLGVIYLIYSSNKKGKIATAAINLGIPPEIAINAANSSNPERAFRSLGVPATVASSLASGTPMNAEIYKCVDSKTGAEYAGPCTTVDANNGWVTKSA